MIRPAVEVRGPTGGAKTLLTLFQRLLPNGVEKLVVAEHGLLTGEVNLTEFRRVLRERFKVPAAEIALVEDQLRVHTIVARPAAPSGLPLRDADDAWVLASALAGGAELLVTGEDRLSVRREPPAGDRGSAGLLGPPASSRVTS